MIVIQPIASLQKDRAPEEESELLSLLLGSIRQRRDDATLNVGYNDLLLDGKGSTGDGPIVKINASIANMEDT